MHGAEAVVGDTAAGNVEVLLLLLLLLMLLVLVAEGVAAAVGRMAAVRAVQRCAGERKQTKGTLHRERIGGKGGQNGRIGD